MKQLTLAAVAVLVLASCYDDKALITSLTSPTITVTEASHNALSFSWTAVNDATQYGYKLTTSDGKIVGGEVTDVTEATFSDLKMLTDYQLHVWAYPTVEKPGLALSPEATLSVQTPFYSLVNTTGTLTSVFLTSDIEGIEIVEERAEENKLGVFTIKGFYGKSGNDLIFSVNDDKTISILNENATIDATTGYKKVTTGSSSGYIRSGVLIDESRTEFDRDACTLTFYAKGTRGTTEGYETFSF